MYDPYYRYGHWHHKNNKDATQCPNFVIEREMPGVGNLSPEQLREAAAKSNLVIRELGSELKWITSYLTDDKLFCVYIAPDEDVLREHARCVGIPADKIRKVAGLVDPASGE